MRVNSHTSFNPTSKPLLTADLVNVYTKNYVLRGHAGTTSPKVQTKNCSMRSILLFNFKIKQGHK